MENTDEIAEDARPTYEKFFSDPSLASDMRKITDSIKPEIADLTRASDPFLKGFIDQSFEYFLKDSDLVDRSCQFNIQQVGGQFKVAVEGMKQKQGGAPVSLAALCYRFLVECQLTSLQPLSEKLSSSMDQVRDYQIPGANGEHIKYADHAMVVGVLRSYLHHKEIVAVQALPSMLVRAERFKNEIEKDLSKRTQEVNELRKALSEYETGFNFVGLFNGFKGMRDEKAKEARTNFYLLIFLALLMVTPFFIKIGMLAFGDPSAGATAVQVAVEAEKVVAEPSKVAVGVSSKSSLGDSEKTPVIAEYILNFLLFVGIELLALYFFRVALHNYRSVRSQLLQLNLRMTLCQFIQSYAEYGKKMRAGGSEETLAKFEQVIFSGIVGGDTDIPSTFDGLDQVVKILDKVRPA
ncbi:MAG: hypothetical protein RSG92_17505 [Pseudomonas sp.]